MFNKQNIKQINIITSNNVNSIKLNPVKFHYIVLKANRYQTRAT